ncbi:polyprenyl synthetase family protein [Streptomyces olivaceiscleroticus]|uniref:Polyprenyl synthetase family protein n=1 Tax=Streptomyces olivaceiscleroticus TaxID=68245 RepID=A0ABN0ZZ19_9ACTN
MVRPVSTSLSPLGPGLLGTREAVDTVLADFLHAKARSAVDGRLPGEITQVLREFVFAGGKRLRPLLCALGWHAAHGAGGIGPLIRTAASLEMFHAFALIHDDLMDRSATRRGRPTVHRALADRHRSAFRHDGGEHLGTSAAILVGDLALAWSDELLHTAGLCPTRLAAVLPVIDAMRTELVYGQYLDLLATGRPSGATDVPLAVIRHKTAKYTCERPLHVGAAVAGAPYGLLAGLSAFALPLGEAFQLRDDLLGVWGRPDQTGKPALDDMREGKHTVLIALALQAADEQQTRLLRTHYGNPDLDEDNAEAVRAILQATGAGLAVERMITERYEQTLAALADLPLPDGTRHHLRQLVEQSVWRAA